MEALSKETVERIIAELAGDQLEPGEAARAAAQVAAAQEAMAGLDGLDLREVEPATVLRFPPG